MTKRIVAALHLLATASAMNPADRAVFDGLLCDEEGAAPQASKPSAAPTSSSTVAATATADGPIARRKRARSAVNEQIVTAENAAANPATTVVETVKPSRKPAKKTARKSAKKK